MFKQLKRTQLHSDKWQTVYVDDIEFPNGSQGTYVVIHRMSGVGMLVTTSTNKILLQKEYRYVIGESDWEIPGGGIDEGEDPAVAGMRELEEETGIHVSTVERLGTFYPLNSLNNEQVTLFHAVVDENIQFEDKSEESESFSERKFFTFEEALQMIDDEIINDAMTAHAIQMVIRKLTK